MAELTAADRAAVLDRLIPIFWMFATDRVPLRALAREAEVGEAVLVDTFGSAHAIYLASLARYAEGPGRAPYRALIDAPAGEEAAAFIRATLDLVFDGDTGRGCMMANAIIDLAQNDPDIDVAVRDLTMGTFAMVTPHTGPRGLPTAGTLVGALSAAGVKARSGWTREQVADMLDFLLTRPADG